MPTPYEKIYENLLPKFRDYDIPIMSIDEVKDYLHDFLIPAITRFHVCRKDLNDRNDILERFNCELSDVEIEILSNYALLEYIDSTYVRTPTLLKAALSSSDFNSYSSANMLAKLMDMRNKYLSENETLLSRYAWMGAKESGILSNISSGYKKSKNR
jgi:hypothetical protein